MDAPNLELELGALIASGDRRRAATALVERFASDVYALCRAMVRDATLAEDLSQEAFGRAIVALETFRGESSARTWVLKIARNLCLDHLRACKRAPIDGGDHDPDEHAIDAPPVLDLLVDREDAQRALGALSENDRAIVVLHFGHGVGYLELAEAFGVREGALRMRVSRALARMREAIATDELVPRAPFALPAIAGAAPPRAGILDRFFGRPAAPPNREPREAPRPPPRPTPGAPSLPQKGPGAPPSAPARLGVAPGRETAPRAPNASPPGGTTTPSMATPSAPISRANLLHEDAPRSLLDRLRTLAALA